MNNKIRSIKDIVSIEECLPKMKNSRKGKTPNKKTLKVIANVEKGKNLVEAKDAEDLFKKLGI